MSKENLNAYLDRHGRGAAQRLADAINVSKGRVSSWKTGRDVPELKHAFAVEDATNGAVPARGWVG